MPSRVFSTIGNSGNIIRGLWQLFRIKPTVSWGFSSFALGVGVAVARAGTDVNLLDGLLMFTLVGLSLGIASTGLNDAYDWITGTDKMSIAKGTGGSRVIPEGKMSLKQVILTAVFSLVAMLAIGAHLVLQQGRPMLLVVAVGILAPVAYSVPPLKMGYRPFNELVVGVPALICVVVGADVALTGDWSWLAVGLGFVHAMFGISWFIVSRVPDYEPDKQAGKITSVVYLGRDNASLLSGIYASIAITPVPFLAVEFTPAIVVSVVAWFALVLGVFKLEPYNPEHASRLRLRNMHITTAHGFGMSILLPLMGV
ncbi:hypothetical protein BRC85_05960 [Halobacteriales archaeon QS_1_69_70]|nr:MAG: hypothetical protein BRC85_05960 [Halobacteriales archaeon QS_1_69_70]